MEVKEREAGHFDIRSHSDACRHMPLKKLNFWLKKNYHLTYLMSATVSLVPSLIQEKEESWLIPGSWHGGQ